MRTGLLFSCGLGSSLLMVGCAGASKKADVETPRQPNVIFIVADD